MEKNINKIWNNWKYEIITLISPAIILLVYGICKQDFTLYLTYTASYCVGYIIGIIKENFNNDKI